jgi:hypothetical protein
MGIAIIGNRYWGEKLTPLAAIKGSDMKLSHKGRRLAENYG